MNYKHSYLVVAGLFVLAPLAQAQVEEITVSAQRREANLQEVPISVSAFASDDISRLQINYAQDIATNVPNMKMFDVTANDAAMQVFMRGAGIQNPGFNASESPVGLYVDDVYRGRLATANLDVADIERIEVLRGPQGTLYGRNTIAGAVKYITRDPGDEFWTNATAAYGNFETTKITASVGGPLVEGKLGGSLAGMYNKRGEGWITRGSTGGRDLGEYENKALRGKLNWYGGEVFSSEFSLSYIDNDNDGYNGIPYFSGDSTPPPPTKPDYNPAASPGVPVEGFYDTLVPDSTVGSGATEQLNSMLRLNWDLGAVTISSITGYSDIDDAFAFDLSGGAFQCYDDPLNPFDPPCPGGLEQTPIFTGNPGVFINSESNNKTITQEFVVSGESGSIDWIAGAFFMNEEGDQQYAPSLAVANAAILEDVDTKTNSYAIYGEGTWAFTERWSLTVGARWTRDEKEWSENCTNLGAGTFPACYPTGSFVPGDWSDELEKDFSKTTPRALLQFQVTENTLLWGSVSSGFQAGGFQTLCFGFQACYQNIYDPQDVVSTELGIKTDLANNTIRINASTFYAAYSDMQQTAIDPNGTGLFPVINVGGADVFGIELETYWSPLENLDFYLIFGYADDKLDSESKAQLPTTEHLPGLPKTAGKLGVDWRVPVFSSWNFLVGADVDYSDEYYATIGNELLIDSYTRLNGRLGFDQPDGNWSLILAGTNLTDEEDLYSGIAGGGTNIRTPQRPREYMLTLGYRY